MIVNSEGISFQNLNDKVSRRILITGNALMMVEYCFQKGGVGEMHSHEIHEQVGYVAKGSFEITAGDQKKIARAGDCYYAAKNVTHGVVALEDNSVLIDIFTPIREDFL